MLNCTLNQREYQYQNLNNFTNQVYQEIVDITSNLGWTVESIETDVSITLIFHRSTDKIVDMYLSRTIIVSCACIIHPIELVKKCWTNI